MNKSIFLIALLCGACGQVNQSNSQAIFGDDEMRPVSFDPINVPEPMTENLAAIGKLSGGCTAFHVGDGVVATAGHCLKVEGRQIPCEFLTVTWPETTEGREASSRCLEVISSQEDVTGDLALLKVFPFPKSALSIADQATIDSKKDPKIAIVGYPKGRPMSYSQCDGVIKEVFLTHLCDTLYGHSGSPVINRQTGQVLAVHDGGLAEHNYATPISNEIVAQKIAGYKLPSWNGEAQSFGPFQNNQWQLLATITDEEMAHFVIEFDIEETYDLVSVISGNGLHQTFSGVGLQELLLSTPVTVVFKSDYAGPSKSIRLLPIH